jgi:hypothetical protein
MNPPLPGVPSEIGSLQARLDAVGARDEATGEGLELGLATAVGLGDPVTDACCDWQAVSDTIRTATAAARHMSLTVVNGTLEHRLRTR